MGRLNVCRACNFYSSGGKSRIAIKHTCNEYRDIGDFDVEEENKYFNKYIKLRLAKLSLGIDEQRTENRKGGGQQSLESKT